MDEMTTRERFHAIMEFRPFDRLPLVEWAVWWDKTVERWHTEKLPATLTDRYDICRHFGLELYLQDWVGVRGPDCPTPPRHGAGIIANESEYEQVRRHLYPWPCIDRDRWRTWARRQERGEVVLWFSLDGFFWFARGLLGIEPHLYAFYDQPALMHRINADLLDWQLRVMDEICSICTPDFMTFGEDMSYNHGPMLSRELFDEFLKPYYERSVPRLKEHGVIPIVDSDGDVTVLAAWLRDVGLEGVLPLERQAGVDIAKLRRLYPEMKWIGHFDKMVMDKGEEAIRGEFERLLPTAARGGFIISCDHQTPPGVSYDDYVVYMRLFREYAEKAGAT